MANVTFTVPNKNGSYDGDMVVKQYTSAIIDSGDTVTTDQPCRGLFMLVKGDLTVNGTLSMSARGAFANPTTSGGSDSNNVDTNGLRFPFITSGGSSSLTAANTLLNGCGTEARSVIANFPTLSSDGTIISIPRVGTTRGSGANANNNTSSVSGGAGGTTTNGCGGGGAGKAYYNALSQDGGLSGCFGGGSGSGAVRSYSQGNYTNPSSPGDYGGAGGVGHYSGQFNNVCGGGAGNPGGTSAGSSTSGSNGTGGVIVLVVAGNVTIGASGKILANGAPGGVASGNANDMEGGASGGGRIIIAHTGTYTNNGTVQAVGGKAATSGMGGTGGDGGAGTVTVQQIA